MKRFSIKSFIFGVLATALVVGSALPGFAEATMKTAELYYNSIKVRLNGKILELRDAKGNPVEPFVMDGTTYLPVRAIAEALGLQVEWDGETQTVVLGQDPEYDQPAAWLGDLKTFPVNTDILSMNPAYTKVLILWQMTDQPMKGIGTLKLKKSPIY